jgi:hypothetical protein
LIIDIIVCKYQMQNVQIINKYEITAVIRVKTNIITNIAESPKGQTLIILIKYVLTFKSDVVFIMCLTSHWPINFSIRSGWLVMTTSLTEIKRKNVQITNNIKYFFILSIKQIKQNWTVLIEIIFIIVSQINTITQ